MKTTKKILSLLLVVTLWNCTSVRLTDTSFTIEKNSLEHKKILVVARSEDQNVRKAYEKQLTKNIRERGFDAEASHIAFPGLKEKLNRTPEETEALIKSFKNKGYKSVLLTSLRNKKILKQQPTPRPSESVNNAIYEKGKYYGISFVDYYNVNSIEYLSRNLRPSKTETMDEDYASYFTSTVYTLEAVVYDLTLAKNNQLAGVYDFKVTDPKSAKKVLKEFSKIVAKQLK